VLRLNVTRHAITFQGPNRETETTRAVVALCVDGWRVGITAVGETEAEIEARFHAQPVKPIGGLFLKLIAGTKRSQQLSESLHHRPPLRFIRAGEDAWWDSKWQDPYALRGSDSRRSQETREILLLEPLSEQSWSPHLIRGLFMYVLWTSAFTRDKLWPRFQRPKIELHAAPDLAGLHYAELVDQVRSLWGPKRVALPPGREVEPLPRTKLQTVYRVSRSMWWAALAFALLLHHSAGEPPPLAVLFAAVAVIAIIVSRVAKGRMDAELPRRATPTRAIAP
jgi:hypothetical protein